MDMNLEFIRNPNGWPLWPFLPMKHTTKHNDGTKFSLPGILYHRVSGEFAFYENVVLDELKDRMARPDRIGGDLLLKQLIKDGWEVQ